MLNKLFNKDNDDYNEAYLKIKNDKVIEEEKTKRIELGEIKKQDNEPEYEYIAVSVEDIEEEELSNETETTTDVQDDSYELTSSRENPAYRSAKGLAFLTFTTLLILSSATIYRHHLSKTLNKKLDSSFVQLPLKEDIVGNKIKEIPEVDIAKELDEVVDEEFLVEDIPNNIDEQFVDNPKNVVSDLSTFDDIEKVAANIKDTLMDDVEANNQQDVLKSYSDIHAKLVFSTDKVREGVQEYVTGMTAHISMTSSGGRVRADMQALRFKLNKLPDNEMKSLLERRLNRVIEATNNIGSLTKDNALDETNLFINQENEDGQYFIELLVELLESEGRNYRLEDGMIYFD